MILDVVAMPLVWALKVLALCADDFAIHYMEPILSIVGDESAVPFSDHAWIVSADLNISTAESPPSSSENDTFTWARSPRARDTNVTMAQLFDCQKLVTRAKDCLSIVDHPVVGGGGVHSTCVSPSKQRPTQPLLHTAGDAESSGQPSTGRPTASVVE